jgi:hypothetical protein
MPNPTTDGNASVEATPEMEIAEIEKAQSSEAGEAKQPEKTQELSAFEKLAEVKGFSSVDDLVKSYENLESKLAPQSRELKELKSMVQKIQESTTPKEEDPFGDLPQEQKEAISLLEKIVARQLDQRLSPLVQKAEVEEAKSKIQAVKQTYPDTTDSEIEHALEVMEKYPKMELDEAIKLVSFDKTYQRATTLSKKTASTQQNRKAFAESASEARQGDDLDYSKMTLEELEKIIPKG